jgi:2,3-bisphosphoglycerate-dependent phosphoglycerate mutase
MTTIYLVRHGESEANVRRIFSNGKVDLPLTDLGRRQAALATSWLTERGVSHVFTSPLLRARETAQIIAQRLEVDVTILEGLDEVRVGELDGSDDQRNWDLHDQVLARWYEGHLDVAFPGGETLAEALARFEAALREISFRYPQGSVAAVTHGAVQLTVLPRLCPAMNQTSRTLPNVAISTLHVTPDGFTCSLWGSTAHLEAR